MSDILNKEKVKKQYKDTENLDIRIAIHQKYSTNPQGFYTWLMSQYDLKANQKVLELGCGTGTLWEGKEELVHSFDSLILSDFSPAMLEAVNRLFQGYDNVGSAMIDAQKIPFPENTFDVIIANMVLQHVPDLKSSFMEIKRVLKPGGRFYCATYGENGIMNYLCQLFASFGFVNNDEFHFTMQNGKEKLMPYFDEVITLWYQDSLEVSDIEDMIDYMNTLQGMVTNTSLSREKIREVFKENSVNGILCVPKEYGMFIVKKE